MVPEFTILLSLLRNEEQMVMRYGPGIWLIKLRATWINHGNSGLSKRSRYKMHIVQVK